ncbi:MAG: hypothetical protein KA314_13455 [Chloroflexi bacterium]|nr:hypothetical protein [Chloroflexota bacterium]
MIRENILVKYKDQIAELETLLAKVNNSKSPRDVAALTRFLRQHPGLWLYGANLSEWAIMELVNGFKLEPGLKAMYKMAQEQLGTELISEPNNLLEQLLVQQVVLAWFRMSLVEYAYSQATNENTEFKRWDFLEKRLNASQRRFLRACETLARVRKLNVPVVQLNVAHQQINQINQSG